MRILLILFLLLFSTSFAQQRIPITITQVVDGDTVKAKMESGNQFTVRLIGIDCFEAYENHRTIFQANENNLTIKEVLDKGKESKKYLEKLEKNSKSTSFEFKGLDKYSRVLGVLYFDDININQKLINENYCKVYKYKEK